MIGDKREPHDRQGHIWSRRAAVWLAQSHLLIKFNNWRLCITVRADSCSLLCGKHWKILWSLRRFSGVLSSQLVCWKTSSFCFTDRGLQTHRPSLIQVLAAHGGQPLDKYACMYECICVCVCVCIYVSNVCMCWCTLTFCICTLGLLLLSGAQTINSWVIMFELSWKKLKMEPLFDTVCLYVQVSSPVRGRALSFWFLFKCN